MVWFDNTVKCALLVPPPTSKRVVICLPQSTKGFAPNPPLPRGEQLSQSYAVCHGNMNGDVFEDWFENTLLRNLSRDKKKS